MKELTVEASAGVRGGPKDAGLRAAKTEAEETSAVMGHMENPNKKPSFSQMPEASVCHDSCKTIFF